MLPRLVMLLAVMLLVSRQRAVQGQQLISADDGQQLAYANDVTDTQVDERQGSNDEDLYYDDEEDYEQDESSYNSNSKNLRIGYPQPPQYQPPPYPQPSYQPPPPTYEPQYEPAYPPPPPQYQPAYPPPPRYKPKKKKVIVPVYVPDKEKKKMKILSVNKGFYADGGSQLYGKFKSLKKCMKACAKTPSCFAGDYNPWLHKCYQHSNLTACSKQQSHPQFVHFSKVPCSVVDSPAGKVTLGVSMANGLESKGIDSLAQCIKKCATAGPGILASAASQLMVANQACFAIDYDFATHKCFFFGTNVITSSAFFLHCIFTPANQPQPTSQGAVPNPDVVHIQFCPVAAGAAG